MWSNEKNNRDGEVGCDSSVRRELTDCTRQKASAAICLIVTFKVLPREGFLSFISFFSFFPQPVCRSVTGEI